MERGCCQTLAGQSFRRSEIPFLLHRPQPCAVRGQCREAPIHRLTTAPAAGGVGMGFHVHDGVLDATQEPFLHDSGTLWNFGVESNLLSEQLRNNNLTEESAMCSFNSAQTCSLAAYWARSGYLIPGYHFSLAHNASLADTSLAAVACNRATSCAMV